MEAKQVASKGLNQEYTKWLEAAQLHYHALGYRPDTQYKMALAVRSFLQWLETQGISTLPKITLAHLHSYEQYLSHRVSYQGGGLSSMTIRSYLRYAGVVLELAEQTGAISYNPMSSYTLPSSQSTRYQALSRETVAALYANCETLRERCLLHLYYGLGLRRSEGVALNVGDIDWFKGWLEVWQGKGGIGRRLPIGGELLEDLRAYAGHRTGPLLLNGQGNRLSGQGSLKLLKVLGARAGITERLVLHQLRHSIATHLVQSEMALEQISAYLGHGHIESTQRYLHYDPSRVYSEQTHG